MALLGYYDAMWDGLTEEAGHIIYRLSDFLPVDKRMRLSVFSSKDGSIVELMGDGDEWLVSASLEDWRKEWRRAHKEIPHVFRKRLL